MQTNQIQNLISTFAKENKISKAKLQAFADQIAEQVKPHYTGRPKLDKTKVLEKRIKNAIDLGINQSLAIYEIIGDVNKVEFNNTLQAMKAHGVIVPTGKAKTGKQGRQPIIWSIAK